MSKRVVQNSKDITKGDVFVVTNAFESADSGVAGSALTDCTLTHEVDKNGEKFVTSSVTWYGLGAAGVAALNTAISKGGLPMGTRTIKGFQGLVNDWKLLTKTLGHLNDQGDAHVKAANLD